jgi:hypothetical protein
LIPTEIIEGASHLAVHPPSEEKADSDLLVTPLRQAQVVMAPQWDPTRRFGSLQYQHRTPLVRKADLLYSGRRTA